jgi:hypothetical protein
MTEHDGLAVGNVAWMDAAVSPGVFRWAEYRPVRPGTGPLLLNSANPIPRLIK